MLGFVVLSPLTLSTRRSAGRYLQSQPSLLRRSAAAARFPCIASTNELHRNHGFLSISRSSLRLDLGPPSGTMRVQDQASRDNDNHLARSIPNRRPICGDFLRRASSDRLRTNHDPWLSDLPPLLRDGVPWNRPGTCSRSPVLIIKLNQRSVAPWLGSLGAGIPRV
jgi:hypothetical protein